MRDLKILIKHWLRIKSPSESANKRSDYELTRMFVHIMLTVCVLMQIFVIFIRAY